MFFALTTGLSLHGPACGRITLPRMHDIPEIDHETAGYENSVKD